jgi:uncharacterized protein (DUF2141 family)
MTLIAVGPVLLAQTNATSTLIIKIVGARNTKGKIGVALFKSAEGFPQDESKMFQPKSMVIDQKTMSAEAVYTNLPPGTYAVVARHDENNNMKLDKNLFGIPTEGYAISNNPKPRLRAPHWDEASFVLKSPTQSVEVKLLYR